MRLGIRRKLILISIGVFVCVGVISVLIIQAQLAEFFETRARASLVDRTLLAREALAVDQIHHPDEIADRLASSAGARVIIADRQGRVLGDSAMSVHELTVAAVVIDDDWALAAFESVGPGDIRVHESPDDLHSATAVETPNGPRLIQLSLPHTDRENARSKLWTTLAIASVVGLLVAILMSWIASNIFSKALLDIAERARVISRRQDKEVPEDEVDEIDADEFGRLAGSLNRISERIEKIVGRLATEKERFKAVLEGTDQAVLAIDGHRVLTVVNAAAREAFDLPEKSRHRSLVELVRIPELHQAIDAAIDGESQTVELTPLPAVQRTLLARVTPRANGGAVIVAHDVTRLRHLERIRRDFVANVSHELRTPVNVIRVNAETLLDGALDDPKHGPRFVDAIHRNAERMGRLIADLLDISRIESGHYGLNLQPVALADLIEGVAASLEPMARQAQVAIESDVVDELHALADPTALEHVVINLVDNALKYAGPEGTIQIVAAIEDQIVRIEVRDDGPGIEPKHRERLFERFYRVDQGRARHMGGTGLGLSIVKHLIHGMDGRVGYEAREPRGSIFWVELARQAPTESA